MKLRNLIAMMFACGAMLTGCDVLMSSLSGTANMMNCKYEYASISGVTVAGINTSEGVSAANILKLTNLAAQLATNNGSLQSLPLNFTLNLNVTNPNTAAAAMAGLDYIISVDNVQLTSGTMPQPVNIGAGQTGNLPLTLSLDAAKLMTGESAAAVTDLVKNLAGIGTRASNIHLQLRPSFMINGVAMPIPTYVPVSFTFGGK